MTVPSSDPEPYRPVRPRPCPSSHQPPPKYTHRSTCSTPLGAPENFLNPNPPNPLQLLPGLKSPRFTHLTVHIYRRPQPCTSRFWLTVSRAASLVRVHSRPFAVSISLLPRPPFIRSPRVPCILCLSTVFLPKPGHCTPIQPGHFSQPQLSQRLTENRPRKKRSKSAPKRSKMVTKSHKTVSKTSKRPPNRSRFRPNATPPIPQNISILRIAAAAGH